MAEGFEARPTAEGVGLVPEEPPVDEFGARHPARTQRVVELRLPAGGQVVHNGRAGSFEGGEVAELRVRAVGQPVEDDEQDRQGFAGIPHSDRRGDVAITFSAGRANGQFATLYLRRPTGDTEVARHPEDVLEARGFQEPEAPEDLHRDVRGLEQELFGGEFDRREGGVRLSVGALEGSSASISCSSASHVALVAHVLRYASVICMATCSKEPIGLPKASRSPARSSARSAVQREADAHPGPPGLCPVDPAHRHPELLRGLPEHHVLRDAAVLEGERARLTVVHYDLLDRPSRESFCVPWHKEYPEPAVVGGATTWTTSAKGALVIRCL